MNTKIQANKDFIYIDIFDPLVIKINVNEIRRNPFGVEYMPTRQQLGYNIPLDQEKVFNVVGFMQTAVYGYLIVGDKEKAVKLIKRIIRYRTIAIDAYPLNHIHYEDLNEYVKIRKNTKNIIKKIKKLDICESKT